MHPVIIAVRLRDKSLRDAGKPWGLWTPEEAADVMQTGRENIYCLLRAGLIENTRPFARGKNAEGLGRGIGSKTRRITSNGIIAFVQANTSGPDEALTLGNLEAVIRTLSLEALSDLYRYVEGRIKIVSNGGPLIPRQRRTLAAALEPKADDGHPDLFAPPPARNDEGRMTNDETAPVTADAAAA